MKEKDMTGILFDLFDGALPEDKVSEITGWIDESEDNLKIVRETYMLWQAAGAMKYSVDGSTERALGKVHARISSSRWKRIGRVTQRVAAAMFIPLLVASVLLIKDSRRRDPVRMIEVKTTSGMMSTVILPDSSRVWLNSGSTLRYPSRFDSTRDVELTGEGYFKVTKDPEHKFHVITKAMKVEVVGTEFDVDAYEGEGRTIRTTLVNGAVNMQYKDMNDRDETLKIYPGQCVTMDPVTRMVTVRKQDVSALTSWRFGCLRLDNTPVEEALRMVENKYNVRFDIKDDRVYGRCFTGQFKDQRLEVMLEFFSRTSRLRFRRVPPDSGNVSSPETIEVYI